MAVTKIRGNTQIMDSTIGNAQVAAAAGIVTSKLADGANFFWRDGSIVATADWDLGTNQIANLGDPLNPQDAATRAWVLTQVAGISTSGATARVATTANITLSGTQTIDGISGSANDIVLVKNQTAPEENGLYTMAAGAWSRTANADSWAEVVGKIVSVQEGTVNADTVWLSTADTGGTLNTTSIVFTQLPGPSDVLAGAGLTRTGQTIDLVATDTSLTVGANSVGVNLAAGGTLVISSGLKVADGGITGTQLATSVAGDGLSGGGGSALSVNVAANGGIELSSDALQIKIDTGETVKSIITASTGTKINTAKFIVRETPSGAINGANDTFALAGTPVAGKEQLYLNGQLKEPGAGNDYTISGATITMLTIPQTSDVLRVSYITA